MSFATVQQLAAQMQITLADTDPTALLMLATATGKMQDYMGQQIIATAADVVYLGPINGTYVILPEMPVTAVTLVEVLLPAPVTNILTWTTADPTTYTVSRQIGMIAAKPGLGITWPTDPETWRVTYSHGYAVVPPSLVGVCATVAARAYVSPDGVDLERVGGYQAKYSADDFSKTERISMDRYKQAVTA